jgi:hypothetical protein
MPLRWKIKMAKPSPGHFCLRYECHPEHPILPADRYSAYLDWIHPPIADKVFHWFPWKQSRVLTFSLGWMRRSEGRLSGRFLGGRGYDVFCGQFLYKGGAVCRTFCGIELQTATGWRECIGDVELISRFWDCPADCGAIFFDQNIIFWVGDRHTSDLL